MLKNPIVAAILCVIIVISSTVISTHVRLDPWCEEISDGFKKYGGIADQLDIVCTSGAGIVKIAEANGIDCFEAQDLCESLRATTRLNSPHELFTLYQLLCNEIDDLTNSLRLKDLSKQDAAQLESMRAELNAARSAISNDSYNSTVTQFLRRDPGRFAASFARLCGVTLPEQFA